MLSGLSYFIFINPSSFSYLF